MTAYNGEIRPRNQAGKVKLLTLSDLDGRTRAAQHAMETRDAIVADLGGADRLSRLELMQAENTAIDAAILRNMQAHWLKGDEISIT